MFFFVNIILTQTIGNIIKICNSLIVYTRYLNATLKRFFVNAVTLWFTFILLLQLNTFTEKKQMLQNPFNNFLSIEV